MIRKNGIVPIFYLATTRTASKRRKGRLATIEDTFFPIIKDGRLEDFKKIWGDWFVLSDDVRAEKTPGFLKVEWETTVGSMIALTCKTYQCKGKDDEDIKRSTKGAPHFTSIEQCKFKQALFGKLKESENKTLPFS